MKKALIGVAVACVIAVGGMSYASHAKNTVVKEKIDAGIQEVAAFADISYKGVTSSLFSDEVTVEGLVIKPSMLSGLSSKGESFEVTAKSVSFRTDLENTLPRYLDISIKDMQTPPLHDRKAKILIGEKAEQGIKMDMELSYEFKSNNSFVMNFEPEIADIGKIESEVSLGNIDKFYEAGKKKAANPIMGSRQIENELQESFALIDLKSMKISAQNKGFMELFMQAEADRRGVSTTEIKEKWAKSINRSLRRAKRRGKAFEEQFATEALKFIESPNTFTFEAKPGESTRLVDMFKEMDRGKLGGPESHFIASVRAR